MDRDETEQRYAVQDMDFILPAHERNQLISAHVPIIFGCSHVCSLLYHSVPPRRRAQSLGWRNHRACPFTRRTRRPRSHPLGQIVDRYGYDVPDGPRLANLLCVLNDIDGFAAACAFSPRIPIT